MSQESDPALQKLLQRIEALAQRLGPEVQRALHRVGVG